MAADCSSVDVVLLEKTSCADDIALLLGAAGEVLDSK